MKKEPNLAPKFSNNNIETLEWYGLKIPFTMVPDYQLQQLSVNHFYRREHKGFRQGRKVIHNKSSCLSAFVAINIESLNSANP